MPPARGGFSADTKNAGQMATHMIGGYHTIPGCAHTSCRPTPLRRPWRRGAPGQHVPKGRQIRLTHPEEPSVAHGRERAAPDPVLHGPLTHLEQTGDFVGGKERPDARVGGDNG